MSDAVRDMFSAISPAYDKLNRVLSFNLDKGWRRKAVRAIRHDPLESLKVLDLCCGTYDFSIALVRRFPNVKVTAVDFSQDMLDAGLGKIAAEILNDRIAPVRADALDMPFADAVFDVVTCGYGVRNFDDTARGVREIQRVLKPGGQMVVLEFFRPVTRLNRLFSRTYGRHALPWIGKKISGNARAYSYLRDSIGGFLSIGEFKLLLERNGFTDIRSRDFFMSVSSCVSGNSPCPLFSKGGFG